MELRGLHLTQRRPLPGPRPGLFQVGQIWDGRMVASHFPAPVYRGAFAELLSMPEDVAEVELSLHYGHPDTVPARTSDLFYCEGSRASVQLGPRSSLPFSIFVPFELHLEFPHEGEMYVWLALNEEIVPRSFMPVVVAARR